MKDLLDLYKEASFLQYLFEEKPNPEENKRTLARQLTSAEKINNFTLRLIIPKGLHPNSATTEEEFAELIDWAYQQGVLEKSEREILEEIIRLDKKTRV